jgi:hypothetical protein
MARCAEQTLAARTAAELDAMVQRPAESQHLLALLESLRGALRATPPRCVHATFNQLSTALPALLAVLRACRHSALHSKLLLKVTPPHTTPSSCMCIQRLRRRTHR